MFLLNVIPYLGILKVIVFSIIQLVDILTAFSYYRTLVYIVYEKKSLCKLYNMYLNLTELILFTVLYVGKYNGF